MCAIESLSLPKMEESALRRAEQLRGHAHRPDRGDDAFLNSGLYCHSESVIE